MTVHICYVHIMAKGKVSWSSIGLYLPLIGRACYPGLGPNSAPSFECLGGKLLCLSQFQTRDVTFSWMMYCYVSVVIRRQKRAQKIAAHEKGRDMDVAHYHPMPHPTYVFTAPLSQAIDSGAVKFTLPGAATWPHFSGGASGAEPVRTYPPTFGY